ncbi:kinesin-like nuclear fusion protein [Entophlyctis sp. JEL0112]|nr:kinesin-like nuclear fusion protein [Entophlyctis sp. JEL0112]
MSTTSANAKRPKATPKVSVIAGNSATSSRSATASVSANPGGGKPPLPKQSSSSSELSFENGPPPAKKKRPAWDVKGRLEDMEQHNKKTTTMLGDSNRLINGLTEKLNEGQEQISQLVQFKEALESKFLSKEMENGEMSVKLKSLQQELETATESYSREIAVLRDSMQSEAAAARGREDALAEKVRTLEAERDTLLSENSMLKTSLLSQSTTITTLTADIHVAKARITALDMQADAYRTRIACLEAEVAASLARVNEVEAKLREEESSRRRLHNVIQELKGNVRVFCRVRPPITESEGPLESVAHIRFPDQDDKSLELVQSTETATGQGTATKAYPFSFDKVFQPHATQADVFREISQLVQSALDGYNVSIFAYGQTGSGKTYTMEGSGPSSVDGCEGMIPRAVTQIFDTAAALRDKGWTYSFEAWFIEIYNETIRDLLVGATGGSVRVTGGKEKYEIRHVAGKTVVTDVTVVPVTNGKEVTTILKRASSNRAVAATNSNEHSSRSHSVFTLRLMGHNSITDESCEGVLNLIDLAGSERLSVSGSVGERLKETQAINKSLSALGDVIYALANKDQQHVPYRNSKLTYLLQNSLGGNSKTLMFVNVSPNPASFNETLCSLRFATKVRSLCSRHLV